MRFGAALSHIGTLDCRLRRPQARSAFEITLLTGKDQSRIKNRKKVDIFLIPVLRLTQVQKAISYHLAIHKYDGINHAI